MASVGTLTIEMAANVARLQKDMETARRSVDSTMKQIRRSADLAAKALGGLGVALSVGAFVRWIDKALKAADEMKKLSQKTGVAVKDIAGLQLAYKQAGLGSDALQTSMARLSKGMAEGNKAFAAMGLNVKNADGSLRGTRQMLGEVADKFASYRDGAEKTALAMELFGKSGAEVIPLLNAGAKSLAEYDAIARKLGLTLNDETVEAAERFNDTFELLLEGSHGLAMQIGAELLPTLQTLTGALLESTSQGNAFKLFVGGLAFSVKGLASIIIGLLEVLRTIFDALNSLGNAMIALARGDFSGALAGLNSGANKIMDQWEASGNLLNNIWTESGNAAVAAMTGTQKAAKQAAPVVAELVREQKEQKKTADASKDAAEAQLELLRAISEETDRRIAQENILFNLALELAELDADMVGGNSESLADSYARETAMLQARYNTEFALIDQMIEAKQRAADEEKANFDRRQALEDEAILLARKRAKLEKRQALDQAAIDKQAYKARMAIASQYAGYVGAALENLASTQDTTSRKGFETAKAMQTGAAVVNTAGAIMNALATVQPYPLAIAAAASAAVAGAAQIAAIQSAKFGGTGSATFSTPSGGFSGGGGAIGSSVGLEYKTVQESQTEDSLQRLAEAADNASLAVGKMSDVLSNIGDLFGDQGAISRWSLMNAPNQNMLTSIGVPLMEQYSDAFSEHARDLLAPLKQDMSLGERIASIASMGTSSFDSFLKNAIGGGKWATRSAGIAVSLVDGQLKSLEYVFQKKAGSLTHGSKTRVVYSAMDQAFADMLDLQLGKIKAAINLAAAITGTSTNFGAANFSMASIQTAGQTLEAIEAALESFFQNVANALASTTDGLKEFAFAGENAFDALIRLATSLQSVNEQLSLIGMSLLDASLEGANAAYKLQDLMGGAEAFADKVTEYFQRVFDEEMQGRMTFADNLRRYRVAFSLMNEAFADDAMITLPQTRAQYQALVESLDLTTERGASLFAALMDLAPTFGDLTDYLEDMADTALDALENAVDAQRQIYEKQRDTFKGLFDYLEGQIDDLYKNTASTSTMGAIAGRAFIAEALMAARATGALPSQSDLASAVSAVTGGMTSSNYGSSFELQRDRLVLAGRLSQLRDITGTQLTNAEQQLAALDSIMENAQRQVDALHGIDNSVLTVAQAVANLQTALTGIPTGIPQFATGTNYVPQDMLAMVHQGEAIIPRAYNPAAGGGDVADELRQLREENRAQARAMVQLQQRMTRLIEKWDGDGMPEERVVA